MIGTGVVAFAKGFEYVGASRIKFYQWTEADLLKSIGAPVHSIDPTTAEGARIKAVVSLILSGINEKVSTGRPLSACQQFIVDRLMESKRHG